MAPSLGQVVKATGRDHRLGLSGRMSRRGEEKWCVRGGTRFRGGAQGNDLFGYRLTN